MGATIEELTNELDRKAGRRRIQLTDPDGEERATFEITFESNVSLPDILPNYKPVEHPPTNRKLQELVLDLLCKLHGNSFGLDLK